MSSPLYEPALHFVHDHLMREHGVSLEWRRYRFLHCVRVAGIGRTVGEAEGLDADKLELACLLHDVAKFDTRWHVDHGRGAARLVRPWLVEHGMNLDDTEEICQGIAMHTDGRYNYPPESPDYTGVADFTTEPTILARSVGDCDNVDRFAVYRIYESLAHKHFESLDLPAQLSVLKKSLARVQAQRSYHCATATCQRLWEQALDTQTAFFHTLLGQLDAALPAYTATTNELDED
ncbi:MAG: HD domain-containing protein [Actinomycetaceae bacterium]|nr:HD domain-containing protein [Actinomycetaceae bacterium]MDY6082458.1 HD domain-containing protein [Actinomycetaceae bacterium]